MDLFGFILILLPGLVVYLIIHMFRYQNKNLPEYCILVIGLLLGLPILIVFWCINNLIFCNEITSLNNLLFSLKNSYSIILYFIITLVLAPLIAFIYNKIANVILPNIQDKIHKKPFESMENNVWQQITRQYFFNKNIKRLVVRLSQRNELIACGEVKSLSLDNYPNNKEILLLHEFTISLYLNIFDNLQEAYKNHDDKKIEELSKKNVLEEIATYYDFNSSIRMELFNGDGLK
ncbi:MAG: hypothetical protein ACYCX2_11985 [Christensenellales bacterium]